MLPKYNAANVAMCMSHQITTVQLFEISLPKTTTKCTAVNK